MNLKMRMFLVENGNFVTIRDEERNTVSFNSLDEFYRCAPLIEFGVDLSEDWYIDYEIKRGVYLKRSMDGETQSLPPIDVPAYESLINNIETLMDRKSDVYYGETLESAKRIKKRELKSKAKEIIDGKYDWVDMVPYIADLTKDRTQLKSDIDAVVSAFISAKTATDACESVLDVKAVTATWPVIPE